MVDHYNEENDQFILNVVQGLFELKNRKIPAQEIWDCELADAIISDGELDRIAALVWTELADIIADAIHTPTLANDFETHKPNSVNVRCSNAEWQTPRKNEVDHDGL